MKSKRISYSDFMKLSQEERSAQADFFRKKYNCMVPAVIYTKTSDLPELSNCKYPHAYL